MGLAAHSVENKRIRTSVALHNRSPEVKNFVCEPLTSLIGSQSNEIDDPYELHFMAIEEESISSLKESNIEDDIVEREVIVLLCPSIIKLSLIPKIYKPLFTAFLK
ncbi:uncharacterized protein LOC107268337 [Cephus cinctus]|uniref:Uncharacterized protein LOC107268337 n=1 Tax=Cephus cinctus TaxID=211228 RepID=A0AAJ7W1Z3_CEPCN|nr:uncharacterized protein LOC107268337 [Cephus cinctus]